MGHRWATCLMTDRRLFWISEHGDRVLSRRVIGSRRLRFTMEEPVSQTSAHAFANGATFPLNEANTSFVDAGSVVFGIEHAAVNATTLQTRGGLEREYLEGGLKGAGVDLADVDVKAIFFHILGRDRTQYLRLDCVLGADHIDFSEFRWHWHYTPPAKDPDAGTAYDIPSVRTYHYDRAANGPDIWEWWFNCLANRLPDMLRAAGAGELADDLDQSALTEALPVALTIVREQENALSSGSA